MLKIMKPFCDFSWEKQREMKKIVLWTDHIINHFWQCCANCDGQESKLKVKGVNALLI